MSDIKQPTVGRVVHYYPMNCSPKENNGKVKLAAIVSTDDTYPDLHVLVPSEKNPVSFKRTVPHKTNWKEGMPGYWEWPDVPVNNVFNTKEVKV